MCRQLWAGVIALLLLVSSVATVRAEGYVAVYFCGSGTEWQEHQTCQGNGVLDTLCVVAQSPDCFLSSIGFAIEYPPSITWLADIDTPPLTLGDTPTGFMGGWPLPQPRVNMFICRVVIQWNCDHCSPVEDDPITVVPHPLTGVLGWTSCNELTVLVPLLGLTSLICPTVTSEATTWGRVKALYVTP